jgi:hypothetical protein
VDKQVKHLAVLLFLVFPLASFGSNDSRANWTGRYAPCHRHTDLLASEHVNLGVRIATSDPVLAEQFARAMDFWSEVLDMNWHEVDSDDCAIQVVDGTPSLFDFCLCMSARSQSPDQPAFQGWIAFNPRLKLSREQKFLDSVHEIGHLLGLSHNPSESSVMFYFGQDHRVSLDARDLGSLAARHPLRPDIGNVVPVVEPRKNLASAAHD